MTYDPVTAVTILLGGDSDRGDQKYDSLWSWNGTVWRTTPSDGPSWRTLPAVAFDTRRRRLILYGGLRKNDAWEYGTTENDTWEWDGTRWQRRDGTTPGARDHHAMVYDEARGVTVMYGGGASGRILPGETWTLDGTAWTLVADSNAGPGRRVHHAMAYDSRRQRVVLFGGAADSAGRGETWEWDGRRWERMSRTGPAERGGHRMAFDAARGVVVMFGGSPDTATWSWDGTTWTAISPRGPSPRGVSAMAYDVRRGRVVMYGGDLRADLWEWDGTRWQELTPTKPPAVVSCAAHQVGDRTSHSLAYDPVGHRVVMFGGVSSNTTDSHPRSLWSWDGRRWRCLTPDGPPGRADAFLSYDAARNRLVLFGGRVFGPNRSMQMLVDTWEWDGRRWTLVDTAGPGPRIHGAIGYDPIRRRVVMHGGGDRTGIRRDTWEWTGERWREVTTRGVDSSGVGDALVPLRSALGFLVGVKTPRCGTIWQAQLIELSDSAKAISEPGPCFSPSAPAAQTDSGAMLFAGWNPGRPAAAWLWGQNGWRRDSSALPRRRGTAMVYDPWRRRVVLFGGNNDGGLLGDTWEWDGQGWVEIH
jgi:hypothetical protein